MAFWPPSPRFNVSSAARAPAPRVSKASMPPSSSSGCAVIVKTLARVRRECSQRVSPAAPRSTSIGMALAEGCGAGSDCCAQASPKAKNKIAAKRAAMVTTRPRGRGSGICFIVS